MVTNYKTYRVTVKVGKVQIVDYVRASSLEQARTIAAEKVGVTFDSAVHAVELA